MNFRKRNKIEPLQAAAQKHAIEESKEDRFSIFNQNKTELAGTTCCCFGPGCCCRKLLFDLAYNPITNFCRFYLTILNTGFFIYISQTPLDLDFTLINYVCLLFLTIDVGVQMGALGIIRGKNTFLRTDIWNAVDFLIVLLGWFPLIYFVQLTPFRILVFFRYITRLPFLSSLQAILHSFWAVIPKLKGLFVLILVVYLIFVLTGLDLFKGDIGRRCVYIEQDSILSSTNTSITHINQLEDLSITYEPVIPTTWCSHVGFGVECNKNAKMYCIDGNEGYYLGVGSFNIWPLSLVVSFQMISLSGWSQYYIALRGVEGWPLPLLWVVFLIFWIVFIVFNIVISAIENGFGLKQEHMDFEAARSKSISNQALLSRMFSELYFASGGKVLYFLQRRVLCYDCFCGFRRFFISIITSYTFDLFVTFVITINILLEFLIPNNSIVSVISVCFMFVYLMESLMKICVIGPHYFNNFYNILDTVLVVSSISLFILTQSLEVKEQVSSSLYVIRLVRTISILSRFPITRGFMKRVTFSVVPALSIIFFSACVLFVFATLAHMVFKDLSRHEPRGFNSIVQSVLTLFVVLTGDNWEDNMYDPLSRNPDGEEESKLYEDKPHINKTKMYFAKILSGPFFILFFMITNLFLLNFFTAVVLHSYSSAKDDQNSWNKFKKNVRIMYRWFKRKILRIDPRKSKLHSKEDQKKKNRWRNFNPCKSCCDCLRWLPNFIRKSRIYYLFMLGFSLLAVIVLVFDDLPTVDRSQGYSIHFWMFIVDCVLLGVFLFDVVLGGLAEGTKYLFNFFHLLDILFLWELTITVIFESITNNSIPWTIVYIRMVVRSIRPLKVVVQFPDLRIYLNSIKNMLQSFLQLTILLVIVFLIYSIIGNKLFKDRYFDCTDPNRFDLSDYDPQDLNFWERQCTGYFYEPEHGIYSPRTFYSLDSNFDDLGSSVLTLIEMSTLDGWSEEMYYMTEQKSDPYSDLYSLYFLSYVVIVVMFVITISIGIVLGGIMEERDVDSTTTPFQLHWSYIRRYIYIANPLPKKQPLCGKYLCCFPNHWIFRLCIFFVICVDYISIAVQWNNQDVIWEFIVNTVSFLCVFAFCVEDIMKLLATGFSFFLSDLWNQLDLLILFLSPFVLGFLLYYQIDRMVTQEVSDYEFMRLYLKGVTRIVLFLRIIAFAVSFSSVRRIFRTLVLAIPSIINACILLICIMFGYALLGRMIFGSVRFGEFYNQHVNFRSWDRSVLLLLKLLTFDNWRGMMHDLAIETPYCNNEPTWNDCGSAWISYTYFISYGILLSTLTLNLFIGIILDNFSIEFLESGFPITREVVDSFKECWANFDINGMGLIKLKKIRDLITYLNKKKHMLGFDMSNSRGNTMFWIVYHELQRKGGMDEYRSEEEIKETKYLFRSNIMLRVYNLIRSGRNNCWMCITCCKCCGFCKQEQHKLSKKDNLKVSFNDVLLALARLSLDNSRLGAEPRSPEERMLRRKFLEEALDAISQRKFTRSETDIRLERKVKRKNKKDVILSRMKELRKRKIRSRILEIKKLALASSSSSSQRNILDSTNIPGVIQEEEEGEGEYQHDDILVGESEMEEEEEGEGEEDYLKPNIVILGSKEEEEEGEKETQVIMENSDDDEFELMDTSLNNQEDEEEETDDVDHPRPPPSPLVHSDLGEIEGEEEDESDSVAILE